MNRIPTKAVDGASNGWVLPIWNERYDDWRPAQIYVTAIAPGARKGPHLHAKRCGRFMCIRGTVRVRIRELDGSYTNHYLCEDTPRIVSVDPGTPAELINAAATEALVLNMPSPAWHADDKDDWPVEGWESEQ